MDTTSYMPHGMCLLWEPWLVLLYAGSDLLIFLSYSAIPVALLMFLGRRPDLRYRGLVALFAAFILLCGITHLISIVILWTPIYPFHGFVKLLTGIVSAATAVTLFRLIPDLVKIPSPAQLEEANANLRAEIGAHKETLRHLRNAQHDLELKVEQRTAELNRVNARLALATREAVHRSRNMLSIVSSIARRSAQRATDTESFLSTFLGRINALANATASVIDEETQTSAHLDRVVRQQLDPLCLTYGKRVSIAGPSVEINTDSAQQICLALHELATNAQKYGAMATEDGAIEVKWSVTTETDGDERLELTWRESGTRDRHREASAIDHIGFGTTLLTRAVPAMLQGTAEREFRDGGLCYRLSVPLRALQPASDAAADDVSAAVELTDHIFGTASPA